MQVKESMLKLESGTVKNSTYSMYLPNGEEITDVRKAPVWKEIACEGLVFHSDNSLRSDAEKEQGESEVEEMFGADTNVEVFLSDLNRIVNRAELSIGTTHYGISVILAGANSNLSAHYGVVMDFPQVRVSIIDGLTYEAANDIYMQCGSFPAAIHTLEEAVEFFKSKILKLAVEVNDMGEGKSQSEHFAAKYETEGPEEIVGFDPSHMDITIGIKSNICCRVDYGYGWRDGVLIQDMIYNHIKNVQDFDTIVTFVMHDEKGEIGHYIVSMEEWKNDIEVIHDEE